MAGFVVFMLAAESPWIGGVLKNTLAGTAGSEFKWMPARPSRPLARLRPPHPMNTEPDADSVAAMTVNVTAGEEFTVPLSSNRTTGYRWRLAGSPAEVPVRLLASDYETPHPARPGAAGRELWKFKATAPGRAELVLEYVRPWEKNASPAQTLKLTVIVAAAGD